MRLLLDKIKSKNKIKIEKNQNVHVEQYRQRQLNPTKKKVPVLTFLNYSLLHIKLHF